MESSARDDELARVIQLPVLPVEERSRSCFICAWSVVTPDRTYCSLFTEQIDQEAKVAQECDRYVDDKVRR